MIKQLLSLGCALALALIAGADEVKTRVQITSQPAGATVIIDGRDRGTTPLMLYDLAPGRHHLKYRLAGYVERDRFFTTDDGPFIEKNETLVEECGLLLLKTEPEDCEVMIDGVASGRSPRLITNLAIKDSYNIKLVKEGYQDKLITVKFDGRHPQVRVEKMVLDSGVIDIKSEPSGAEVMVNGIVRGVTPLLVSGIPKGRATVKFTREGFHDEVRELEMRAGDQQTLAIMMNALPGTLHLISVPEGARFYVNNEARGKGPLAIAGLIPGSYEVRAEMEGFGTVTRTITLANGQSAREEFQLSSVMGRLEVRTTPPDALIIFDGRLLGSTKSQGNGEVSDIFPIENILEGEHIMVVRKEGYADQTRHPKIRNSVTSKANVRLTRIFVPDVEIETVRGTYRGILISRDAGSVTIEVRLGITQSFSMGEIRRIIYPLPKDK